MQREIKLRDSNGTIFIFCLVFGFINACLGNIALTIFAGALMISCFVDKSGYVTKEVSE